MMMNEEAMTNEEAIKLLSQVRDAILASNSWLPSTDNPIKECFGMAIEALKAQEKAQEVSNDSPELDKENGELISRQAEIDVIDKIFPADPMRSDYTQGITCGAALATEYIKQLPSAQPETHEKRTETHACVCIERQAVEHLDRFTKIYCRDKSITDDLAFRCGKCEFEMPDKTCLVKVMARKLCPDYKDFGAMGDL